MLSLVWESGVSAGLRRQREEEKRDFLNVRVDMAPKTNAGGAIIILMTAVSRGGSFLGPLLPTFWKMSSRIVLSAGRPVILGLRRTLCRDSEDSHDRGSAWHRGKFASKSGGKNRRFWRRISRQPALWCKPSLYRITECCGLLSLQPSKSIILPISPICHP